MIGSEAWIDLDASDETYAETQARGGALSAAGRRAAVAATLPLLGLYFASGTQPLVSQTAVRYGSGDREEDDLARLLAGIRFRVALAAARRLHAILSRIVDRPSFRYQLASTESTGVLTGQLDVNRFVIRAAYTEEVPTYPILTAQRIETTAENTLAAYAALWLRRELHASLRASAALPGGPEYIEYNNCYRALSQVLTLPILADCVLRAREITRRGSERLLLNEVRRRLRRREVPNPTPYADLLTWIDRCLRGEPAAEVGDIEWAFYGERFDTKLFEIWCLGLLAREISRQLVVDHPPVHADWRLGAPAYTWDRPAGQLHLHFQRSLATISTGHTARWRRADGSGRPLGGIPDLVAQAIRRDGGAIRLAILDPKLRQRGGPPIEELYKILGYLDNFGLREHPLGAILFHSTESNLPTYSYQANDGDGQILALALNPADANGSRTAIAQAATMILGMLDIPPLADPLVADAGELAADPERAAQSYVAARVLELKALAEALPVNVLDASRRRVRAMIGDATWNALNDEVRTMLATSEHVGFSLDGSADFSGPVIGICASVEVILHELVVSPVVGSQPGFASDCRTLGQAIHAIRRALASGAEPLSVAIRRQLVSIGADLVALSGLVGPLTDMNSRYRIPAAHRELVTEATWHAAWNKIVGQGALLVKVKEALSPP